MSRYVDLVAAASAIMRADYDWRHDRDESIDPPYRERLLVALRDLPTVDVDALTRERDEARATCEARGRLLDEHRRDCAWRFRAEKAEARVARLEAVAEAAREVIHASEHGTGHDDVRAEDALIAARRALAGEEPAPMPPDHRMAAVVSAIHDERERISREMGIPLDALAMGEQEPAHLSMEGAAGYSGPRRCGKGEGAIPCGICRVTYCSAHDPGHDCDPKPAPHACEGCGSTTYGDWTTDDASWARVHPDAPKGLLCLRCAYDRAHALGLDMVFVPIKQESASKFTDRQVFDHGMKHAGMLDLCAEPECAPLDTCGNVGCEPAPKCGTCHGRGVYCSQDYGDPSPAAVATCANEAHLKPCPDCKEADRG